MRQILFLFFCFNTFLWGCKVIDPAEEIPAYIRITSVNYSGGTLDPNSVSHHVTDAWIYVDGELLGAFEIPCTVPVLKQGVHDIVIFGGIWQNGMHALRPIYPFYTFYESTVTLKPTEITEVAPSFTYTASTDKHWHSDFDGQGTTVDDATSNLFPGLLHTSTVNAFEGRSATILLDAGHYTCLLQSSDSFVLDPAQEIYLELNYRSDIPMQIGLSYTNPATSQRVLVPWMETFATASWKKLYVRLNDCFGTPIPGVRYRPYILLNKPEHMNGATIQLDNLKLLN
jgi:hypothetical protein